MLAGIMSPLTNPPVISAAAREAEARGFHSVWAIEHVVLFNDYESKYPYTDDGRIFVGRGQEILDPFGLLAFIAGQTSTIRLGTGICLVPQRNPVYTAKDVATVDYLSGGRFNFGVGIGWQKEEFEALGVSWPRRAQRTAEYIELMKRLWSDPVTDFAGEFHSVRGVVQNPKPVQKPHPPIYFGGESDPALARVAAIGDGWFGFNLTPAGVRERLAKLDELLAANGRTRADVRILISPYTLPINPDTVAEYAAAGVQELVTMSIRANSMEAMTQSLDVATRDLLEPAAKAG